MWCATTASSRPRRGRSTRRSTARCLRACSRPCRRDRLTVERLRTRSGSDLHLEDSGKGPAILALHGLGGGAWFFAGFARRLSAEYRVISLDLAGTGRSVAAAEPSTALWVADICDILRDRLGGPAVILGHSLGTILALQASAACPQHIRALIFAGGLPEPRPLIKARLTERAAAVARDGLAGSGPQVAAANFARATLEIGRAHV